MPPQKSRRTAWSGLFLLILLLVSLSSAAWAQVTVQGTITGPDREPIPYATVSIVGTTQGTVADINGAYSLALPQEGSYRLQVRSLGFKTFFLDLEVKGKAVKQDFQLEGEELILADQFITADGRDPAYGIMREAIRRRRQNDQAVKAYSANVYTKVVGTDLKAKKIEFLSETFSTLYVDKPDKRKEVIHNSRVSGDSREFSAIGGLMFNINPYKSLISFPQVFVREFVAPLADNAFFFYEFKLLGTQMEKGAKVYKIEVIPRRAADPVFAGVIYIVDGSYAIKGFDLRVVKDQPIRYFDTLRIKQDYLPVRDSLWVLFRNEVSARLKMNVLVKKFDVSGVMMNVYSNYTITSPSATGAKPAAPLVVAQAPAKRKAPKAPKKPAAEPTPAQKAAQAAQDSARAERDDMGMASLGGPATSGADGDFYNEVLRVDKRVTAMNRNVTFWDSLRPAALTTAEQQNFLKGDSAERRRNSPEYIDSVNRARNKFKLLDLLQGYTWTNVKNKNILRFSSPLTALQFNTMEGWNVSMNVYKTYNLDPIEDTTSVEAKGRRLTIDTDLRYGFSNKRFSWWVLASYRLNRSNSEVLSVEVMDHPQQFSPAFMQITPTLNTLYSLIGEQNYLKMYQQAGGRLAYQRRLNRNNIGVVSVFGYRYSPLPNTTDYVSYPKENREYTPNIELPQAYTAGVQLTYNLRFGSKYITLPSGRVYINNPLLPSIGLEYSVAQNWTDDRSLNTTYHKLIARVNGALDFKLVGDFQYLVRGGYLLRNGEVLLQNQFHARANQTIYRPDELARFGAMDYYTYASQDRYAEVHVEHNFRGFWLNKLPLLRKLKFHEVVGLHSMAMPGLPAHTELLVGITNIRILRLDLFRVNYHYNVTGLRAGQSAVTFTFGINL